MCCNRGWLLRWGFRGEPFLTLNKKGHDGKQEAHGKSTHEYTGDTFYRPQGPPHPRQHKISITDRRIAGCREVECRFPRWKTIPTIKPGPQQNLQYMQDEYHTCESNQEHSGAQQAKPGSGSRKMRFCPMD